MSNVSLKSNDAPKIPCVSALDQLCEMAALIDSQSDWWRFPEEEIVKGFMGRGPLFIVGDQPSTSSWEVSHPNRRALYDLLQCVGAADSHITDLYKRRGRAGSLRHGLPPDFGEHLEFFRKELALLRPTRVVALGHLAHGLLSRHVPEVCPILCRIWHFAYVVRYKKLAFYMSNMRLAFNIGPQLPPNAGEAADARAANTSACIAASKSGVPGAQDSRQSSLSDRSASRSSIDPDFLSVIDSPQYTRRVGAMQTAKREDANRACRY